MKTLYLEKRGCNFMHDEEMEMYSDVGNYRVCGNIVDKYGRDLFVEFTRCDKRRFTNKRTGAPLKKFVVEHHHKLHLSTCYSNFDGSFGCLEFDSMIYDAELEYTVSDILKAVNMISRNTYTQVVVLDNLPIISGNMAWISKKDKDYLFSSKLSGVTETQMIKCAGYREKYAIEHLVGYFKTNDGATIDLVYMSAGGCPCSVQWHIGRQCFTN